MDEKKVFHVVLRIELPADTTVADPQYWNWVELVGDDVSVVSSEEIFEDGQKKG